MKNFKNLFCVLLFCCCALVCADEKAEIRKCVEGILRAGCNMDWETVKKFASADYVKIPENNKVLDRKLLENMAIYWKSVKAPDLTFSELVKLNAMLQGRTLTDVQIANYRKLDSTEHGKSLVKKTKEQLENTENNVRQIAAEVMKKVQYGPMYVKDDLAVWFYKSDYVVKLKGVLVLRKENGSWKLYREFSSLDSEKNTDVANVEEVRKFAEDGYKKSSDFSSYTELLTDISRGYIAVMPNANGQVVNYEKSEKMAKFYDIIESENPTMVKAGPLYMEAFGIKLTPEILAKFADQDKNGQGEKFIQQYKNELAKHRKALKNISDNKVKDIFVFEDCALLIDSLVLPITGKIERISLLKKNQGKYFYYRSVSRKSDK